MNVKRLLPRFFNLASIVALALAVIIASTCLLLPREVAAAWNGTAATSFQSGSGTQASPYMIANESQMGKFLLGLNSNSYQGIYFALSKDLDMTGGTWNLSNTTFAGHLDGRGYTVTATCPFLGNIAEGATVKSLNYICTEEVGRSVFCTINQGAITACVVKGTAKSSVLDDQYSTIGLLCSRNEGTITSCGGIGLVDAYGEGESDAEAGMIAINSGTVSSCYAAVEASASAPGKYDYAHSGPVVGKQSGGTVSNCVYDSTLYTTANNYATGLPTADMKSGVVLTYLGSTTPAYCGWTMDSSFDGYPHVYHLAHNYVAYVNSYSGDADQIYNGTSLKVTLAKQQTGGDIYYTTSKSITDPSKFTKYTGSFSISGDTTISMAVKYNGSFGAVTRKRLIGLPGSGTDSNPYKISMNYQLALMNMLPSATFVLTNNLTFTDADYASDGICPGGWDPITTFSGTFDGKGYAIYGLEGIKGGLFEENTGIVKNLRIVDHRLAGPGNMGAVADRNTGTISRCYAKSAFTMSDLPDIPASNQAAEVGGIAGYSHGTIEYCRNDGLVVATETAASSEVHVGGILGSGSTVQFCVNTGDVAYYDPYYNNKADYAMLGGIAGHGSVENCKAVQKIYLYGSTDYNAYAAGIVARYMAGYAHYCIADYTFEKNATTGGSVTKSAYSTNSSYRCYDANAAQLPSDCADLTFGYGGNWWISNEGPIPQGVIGADGHAWVLKSGGQILPSCTAKGDAVLECAICGQGSGSVSELLTISALGHRYTDYSSDNNATCESDGTKSAFCDRDCGSKKTIADEGSKLTHDWQAATCNAPQTCANCTATQGQPDSTAHKFTAISNQICTDATCIKPATYYAMCAVCSELNAGITMEIGKKDYTNHNFVDGLCTDCGFPQGLQYTIENDQVSITGYVGTLTNLNIPETIEGLPVVAIKGSAFSRNNILVSVTIPDSITDIGSHAFEYCEKLTTITMGTGLKQISGAAFMGCKKLTDIYIDNLSAWLKVKLDDSPMMGNSLSKNIYVNDVKITELTIPADVTAIGKYGLYGWDQLTSVSIGDHVTSIGDSSFRFCDGLTEITIPASVTSIGYSAFYYLKNLNSVTILGQTEIGDEAFSYSGLQYAYIYGGTTIGARAFYECQQLRYLILPDTLIEVEASAFDYCRYLWHVLYAGTQEQWEKITIGSNNYYFTNRTHHCQTVGNEITPADDSLDTCTDDAIFVCSICNDVLTDSIWGGAHSWDDATCNDPKTCSVCGTTEGDPLGHSFNQKVAKPDTLKSTATCVDPAVYYMSCACGEISTNDEDIFEYGTANGHTWKDATCSDPKTCSVCGSTEGAANGHSWKDATCSDPKSCSACPATEGDPNPVAHKFDGENVCEYCGSTGGQCGDTLYWALNSRGLLTIYGEGDMYDYEGYDNPSPLRQNSSIKEIIVYGGSGIGEQAFLRCENLTSVTIHDGVTSIGVAAFAECSNLSKVIIPASVTNVGPSAFAGCAFKSAGPIGGDYDYQFGWTTAIPANAFTACIKLDSVVIPESVTSIGESAFSGCEALFQITIPGSVSTMGRNVFSGTAIKSAGPIGGDYDCQFGWTSTIPENAFFGCKSLESVVFPDSISSIGDRAFYSCAGLVTVELPRQLTTIGVAAFAGCESLVQITLPDGVTTLGNSAFSDCGKLADVVIPASVTTMGSNVFYDTAIKSAGPIGGDYDCQFGWTTAIPAKAFENCYSLESVVIPEGITSIGEKAFYSSSNLSSVIIPDSVVSIDSFAFSYTEIKTAGPIGGDYDFQFGWTSTIPANIFYGCTWVESVVIPKCITSIGAEAFFSCRNLSSVSIPEGVTSIGDSAFAYCTGLSELVIPDGVTSIDGQAFWHCENLSSIIIPGSVTSIGGEAFTENGFKSAGPIGGDYDFQFGWKTEIPENAFYACTNLESVVIPEGITAIGKSAFSVCKKLTAVTIPASVTTIGEHAFNYSPVTELQFLGSQPDMYNALSRLTATAKHPCSWKSTPENCGGTITWVSVHGTYTAKVTPPTCTEDGYTTHTCPGCGDSYTDTPVPATDHSWKEATCIDPKTCSICGTTEGDSLGHSFNRNILKPEALKSNATCVDPAVYFKSCSCGEISTDEEDIFEYGTGKGHSFNQEVPKTETLKSAATCVDPAVYYLSCSCGEISADEKDTFEYGTAKGHTFNQKVAKTETLKSAATCVDPAVYYLSCSCGEISTDEKDTFEYGTANGHTWKDATCSDPKTCSVCGTTEGSANGHSWKNATCNDPKTCSVCGSTEGTANGHSWKDATCSDPKTCSVCGTTEGSANGHSWKNATCSDPKTCSVCGSTESAAKGHSWKDATCNDPKTCSVCGETTGTANGHSWSNATCTAPKTCRTCGDKEGDALGHSWNNATCTAPKTCSVCGSTEGAAKGHNFSNGFCGACGESDPNYVPAPPASGIQRLAGNTRYATAIEAADELKTLLGVDKFSSIIVSSGENFADALAGSYLASVKDASILLVNSSTIKTVKEYIKSNLIPGGTVYLLGGVSAVPAAMESGLDSFTVKRLGGATRYDTNLMILQEAGVTDEDIIVCTGKNFADSLSASATGLPILLVKDGLTAAQKEFLDCTSGRKIIIGGENAVSKRVETQLASYGEVSRLAGSTRYDTSVLVAKTFFTGPSQAVIAYGENFPDGLSGGPVANAIGAPLILTRSGRETAAAKYVSESGISGGYVLGGTAVLPDKTVNKVFGTK